MGKEVKVFNVAGEPQEKYSRETPPSQTENPTHIAPLIGFEPGSSERSKVRRDTNYAKVTAKLCTWGRFHKELRLILTATQR